MSWRFRGGSRHGIERDVRPIHDPIILVEHLRGDRDMSHGRRERPAKDESRERWACQSLPNNRNLKITGIDPASLWTGERRELAGRRAVPQRQARRYRPSSCAEGPPAGALRSIGRSVHGPPRPAVATCDLSRRSDACRKFRVKWGGVGASTTVHSNPTDAQDLHERCGPEAAYGHPVGDEKAAT